MNTEQKRMALIAGVSLLVMAVVAAIVNFGVVEKLIDLQSATTTAENFASNEGQVRLGVLGFSFVILLDFVVAWSLYYLFRPISESIARLMAILRIVGATLFAASLTQLWMTGMLAQVSSVNPDEVLIHAETFLTGWNIGLGYFGIHLILVAALLLKGGYNKVIAGLVAIAGLGYVADTAIAVLAPTTEVSISIYTFVGELLLMIWLLVKARRRRS